MQTRVRETKEKVLLGLAFVPAYPLSNDPRKPLTPEQEEKAFSRLVNVRKRPHPPKPYPYCGARDYFPGLVRSAPVGVKAFARVSCLDSKGILIEDVPMSALALEVLFEDSVPFWLQAYRLTTDFFQKELIPGNVFTGDFLMSLLGSAHLVADAFGAHSNVAYPKCSHAGCSQPATFEVGMNDWMCVKHAFLKALKDPRHFEYAGFGLPLAYEMAEAAHQVWGQPQHVNFEGTR